MADLSRGTRSRRGVRRPGWLLLTVLLVLAIGASSALVFTNKVELLKLAVILSLWAAVVAAFVSVIYRRQSDIDQAKARDLKLVYDLQLDREITARREYELAVETQLRRELSSELRAQSADEVAGLRAELAALRANLEILFDADLSHRPALESDRARAYDDWPRTAESTGRVTASRIDTEDREDVDANTEESPIIDVPAEPHPPEPEWGPQASYGGAHRRPSETEQEERRRRAEEAPRAWSPPPPPPQPQFAWQPPQQERPPAPPPEPPPPPPRPEPERVAQAPSTDWQPAPAEGQWIPVGTPGSNWVSPVRCRLSRRARTVPQANMSAEGAHPIRRPVQQRSRLSLPRPVRRPSRPRPIRRLSRPCSLRPAPAAATRRHRMPSIRDARLRRPRWPPNRATPRHTPSPSRARAAGDAATP